MIGVASRLAAKASPRLPHDASRGPGGAPGGRDTILVVGAVALGSRVTKTLMAAGFTLVRVEGVLEAQRLLGEHLPAAILLEPALEGDPFAVVRALRESERSAFVQLFVFATRADGFRMVEGIAAGADDVFVDPRDHEEAAERIMARIARSGALAQLALLDPLTNLYNRRFLNDRVPAEVGRAARSGTLLCAVLIDLDGFKGINDAFGHTAGDRVLVAFASALRCCVRGYDLVGRFGGDEFILVLPECGVEGCRAALSNLRARRLWALPGLPAVTFSAGVAQFPDDGLSWAVLFEAADQNVRAAKSLGGGKTVGRDRS
jgi:two-component system, cell cycle response regulator